MIPEPIGTRLDRKHRLGVALAFVILLAVLLLTPVLSEIQLTDLHQLGNENHALNVSDHQVLASQIKTLNDQIAAQKSAIAADNNVIQQEVAVIERIAKACIAAPPCSPGTVDIKAPPDATVP